MTKIRNYLERALNHVEVLPPISNVFYKILDLTDDEKNPREALIRCVSLDQAIAAKVLQTINSAYFGMGQKVSSLEVAVGLLGDKQIRDIAIMCTASGLLRVPIRGYGVPANQFWLHSVTAAIAARLLAERFGAWHRDAAFAAGLLHDIGILVIDRLIERPDKEVLAKIGEEMVPGVHSKEIDLYGFDHCAIGFFLARKWNFTKELTAAIAFHHYPDLDVDHREMIQVVYFADVLAHMTAMEEWDPEFVVRLETEGSIPFDLSAQAIEEIYGELMRELGNSKAFLGIEI